MQPTPLRVDKIVAILASGRAQILSRSISGGAADGHTVGRHQFGPVSPLGGNLRIAFAALGSQIAECLKIRISKCLLIKELA
jgi:hypothetical protein